MNGNNSAKGWLSCLILLLIFGLIFYFVRVFWWVIFLVLPVINLIRGLIWRRRIQKTMSRDFGNNSKPEQDNSNYCEAEFEIIDDDTEPDKE